MTPREAPENFGHFGGDLKKNDPVLKIFRIFQDFKKNDPAGKKKQEFFRISKKMTPRKTFGGNLKKMTPRPREFCLGVKGGY